jgi:hypothetical protein
MVQRVALRFPAQNENVHGIQKVLRTSRRVGSFADRREVGSVVAIEEISAARSGHRNDLIGRSRRR